LISPDTKISKTLVDIVFDEYASCFRALAEKEDELEKMKDELVEYKEGGSKYIEAQQKIHEFEHTLMQYQRALRLSGLEIDRVKTLIQVELIAKK
jgi:hypothetical protein